MLTTVEIFANNIASGNWIVGRGWIEKVWPEKRFPTKYDLDRFSSDKPVILERADGHAVVVNSLALKIAGINSTTLDPHGGRIEKDGKGEPTGMLIDKATLLVEKLIPQRTRQEDKRDFQVGINRNVSLGWTQVQIAGGTFLDVELLKEIKQEGNLLQRIYFAVSEGDPAKELLERGAILDPEHMLTVRGIKHYADGALGSRGAALLEKYNDDDTDGLLIFKKEEIMPVLKEALQKGIQIQTHAIGDRGNKVTLDWYQEAFDSVSGAVASASVASTTGSAASACFSASSTTAAGALTSAFSAGVSAFASSSAFFADSEAFGFLYLTIGFLGLSSEPSDSDFFAFFPASPLGAAGSLFSTDFHSLIAFSLAARPSITAVAMTLA